MLASETRLLLTDAQGRANPGLSAPAIPQDFLDQLRAFDPDLFVLWSATRNRYFIYQCTRHVAGGKPTNNGHTDLCQSIYVLACQDRDGVMVPLNERVLTTLREMRAESERFGGQTERGLRNYLQHSSNLDQELEEKRRRAINEMLEQNARDHRMQINRAWNLIERHDMRPNERDRMRRFDRSRAETRGPAVLFDEFNRPISG